MTRPAYSVWAYPWDLHDIGLDRALGLLADQGVTMVSLATSYHAGRFLQPGNPKRRVYFPEDGTVYYQPDLLPARPGPLDRSRDRSAAGSNCRARG